MANCPNCKKHLRIVDWKQKCPHCGANIVLYDMQERLMQDADKAEVQYYYFQKKIDRLKAAFVGSKLSVARIFTSLLPIAGLFLPIVKCNFSEPLSEMSGKLDILKIYNTVGDINLGEALSSVSGADAPFLISVILFLLSIVLILVHFILLTLSASPKGKARSYILNTAMLASSVIAAICFSLSPTGAIATGSVQIGGILYILLFALNFAIEIVIYKKGVEVHHKQCYVGGIPIEEYFKMLEDNLPQEEIRREMYKRLTEIEKAKQAEKEQENENKKKKDEVNSNV